MTVWPVHFWTVLAFWALILHGTWKIAQAHRLYTCRDRWGRMEGVLWMSDAIVGDVLITGFLVAGTAGLTAPGPLLVLVLGPLALLLLLSVGTSVLFEGAARRLDLWSYRPAMPTIRVFALEMGVSPLLQMSLLPVVTFTITVHFSI